MTYTKEELIVAIEESDSISDVQRYFGEIKSGSAHQHLKRRIKTLGLDTSHFTGSKRSRKHTCKARITPEIILTADRLGGRREATHRLRRAMLEAGVIYCCGTCGNRGEWLGASLRLEIDHINENRLDNNIDNLRFLCPNCHSLRGNNLDGINKIIKIEQKRVKKSKICSFCKETYTGVGKKYCSNTCKNSAEVFKSKIPSKEVLEEDFKILKYFTAVSRKYGVSDNSVRKWCKKYKL